MKKMPLPSPAVDCATPFQPREAPAAGKTPSALPWPRKYELFGVRVSATTYDEASDLILDAARRKATAVASFHPVHAIVAAARDPELRAAVNAFELIGPDGQPVRWALNLLHRTGLRERVYGPELMLQVCAKAAEQGVAIYLYGSSPTVISRLVVNLTATYPGLKIAGAESPPYRQLNAEEEDAMVRRINESGAAVVFIGLGCPKQDRFAHAHRHRIRAVQVCVGAAFDFHAGTKRMAPRWMQRWGMEWCFRLCEEPRRLSRRYVVTNTVFVVKMALALVRPRRSF
jgi:exopolysaccharide biosynthesis WecB/TagA/CpsF family protein